MKKTIDFLFDYVWKPIALVISEIIGALMYGVLAGATFYACVVTYAEAGETMVVTFTRGIMFTVIALCLARAGEKFADKLMRKLKERRKADDSNNQPTASSGVMFAHAHNARQHEEAVEKTV